MYRMTVEEAATKQWKYYQCKSNYAAQQVEDLTLEEGDLIAVASSGEHETGYWEGFRVDGS